MSMRARLAATTASWHDERHGPLPPLLLILTLVTGLVDAVSYLKLGHVFVANMTGNVVFLGFAVADAQDFSISASLAAIAAFLLGALAGGRLAVHARHRGRLLALATAIELVLVAAALALAMTRFDPERAATSYPLIALLAFAMGVQNAAARRLGVPDLTTTVLTLTLTGFAADSTLAGGKNPNPRRRLLAVGAMFLGATIGAVLVLRIGVAIVLGLSLALLAGITVAAATSFRSAAAWTADTR
jgi:uncharacterized membrane protein YoaK (UPF0700 family)